MSISGMRTGCYATRCAAAVCLALLSELSLALGQRVPSSVALSVSPAAAVVGQLVTLSAAVTCATGSIDGGSVRFASGPYVLGTAQVVGVTPAQGFATGSATLKVALPAGTHQLIATFNGTETVSTSSSESVSISVTGLIPVQIDLTAESTGTGYLFSYLASAQGTTSLTGNLQLNDITSTTTVSQLPLSTSLFGLTNTGSYQVGNNPSAILSADFRGDGSIGIVAANLDDDSVTVFAKNPATGALDSVQTLKVGKCPSALAAADFNGDGLLDLAVANSGDNTVNIFFGNPENPGTFTVIGPVIPVGSVPVAMAIGDFDFDGSPDLAVLNYLDSSVTILLGNPQDPGSFTTGETLRTGQGPVAVAVADLNGDGVPDLAIANYVDGTVWILAGDPAHLGQFLIPTNVFATGRCPTSLAVADLNGDGIPDLVVSNWADGTISIMWGNADQPGIYPTQQIMPVGAGPVVVGLSDINGDGLPDIIVSNTGEAVSAGLQNNSSLGLLLNEGTGTFGTYQSWSTGAALRQVTPDPPGLTPAGLAGVDVMSNSMKSFSIGTSASGSFQVAALTGTGIHNFELTLSPDSTSAYGASVSNVVPIDLPGVTPLPQSITFNAFPQVTYGNGPIILSAQSSSGLPVSYTVTGPATLDGTSLFINAAGTIVVVASQAGNTTYAAANPVSQVLLVNRAPLTVTPNDATRLYGIANPAFTGSIVGVVNDDNITATYGSDADMSTPPGTYSTPPLGISATLSDPNSRLSNYSVTQSVGVLTIQIILTKPPKPIPIPPRPPFHRPRPIRPGEPIPPGQPPQPGPVPVRTQPPGPKPIHNPPPPPRRFPIPGPGPIPVFPPNWARVFEMRAPIVMGPDTRNARRATETVLAYSPDVMSQSGALTITVRVLTRGGGVPSGTVALLDNHEVVQTTTLDARGYATVLVSGLERGGHKLSAQYSGDQQNRASGSQSSNVFIYSVSLPLIYGLDPTQLIETFEKAVVQLTDRTPTLSDPVCRAMASDLSCATTRNVDIPDVIKQFLTMRWQLHYENSCPQTRDSYLEETSWARIRASGGSRPLE